MLGVAILPFFLLASSTIASPCPQDSIYVDIHNRMIAGSEVYEYGCFIGIGTPNQKQSFWPSLSRNDTTTVDVNFCSESPSFDCDSSTHGFFDADESSTFVSVTNFTSLDYASIDTNSTILAYGTDTLHVNEHFFEPSPPLYTTNLTDFPVTILSNYTSSVTPYFGPSTSIIGLGPSSPLLARLVAANAISSKSYGLYLGTFYPGANGAINGSLTLGGYDSARLTNPVHSYPIVADTVRLGGLKVHVSQMTLLNSGGPSALTGASSSSIPLISDSGFDAYISTSQYQLTIPKIVLQALGGTLSNASDPSIGVANTLALPAASSSSSQNLTITLAGGFAITFPPEWLSNVSNIAPFDTTPLTESSSDAQAVDGPFILGTAFLEYVYLAVNYDTSSFFLAPALPDAAFIQPAALCGSSGDDSASPSPAPDAHLGTFVAAGLVGAVVGGGIGAIALSLAGWCLLRSYCARRARRRQLREKEVKFAGLEDDDDEYEYEQEQELQWLSKRMEMPGAGSGASGGRKSNSAATAPEKGVGGGQGKPATASGPREKLTLVTDFSAPPRKVTLVKGGRKKKGILKAGRGSQ